MRKYAYGWKKGPVIDHPHKFLPEIEAVDLPAEVDLTPQCPAVYDQGQIGSCTGNSAAGFAEFLMMKLKLGEFVPSRLAIYWWNRLQDGTTQSDDGSTLAHAMNSLVKFGVPHESLWPYSDQGNQFAVKPSKPVWSDGYWHSIDKGLQIGDGNLAAMKSCLAQGYPFIFGFVVYESFESDAVANTGIMPMPKPGEQVVGGHAVCAVGYNDATQMVKVRNSWGAGWGMSGYFEMPYAFISDPNQASDFWTAHNYIRFKK